MRVALLASLPGCDAPARGARGGAAAPTPASLLADSAAGDSAALASLPPRLAAELAIAALLTDDALADTARVRCESLAAPGEREERRRLRATLADGGRAVLFARATRDRWALRRVELVRRARDGSQRGFIWDGEADAVRALEWPAGAGARPEVTTLPRSGPLPRALRALARRLLTLPCAARAPRG